MTNPNIWRHSFLRGFLILLLLLTVFAASGCTPKQPEAGQDEVKAAEAGTLPGGTGFAASDTDLGWMKVHYLDVGQGDCVFIETDDGHRMLIDAGERQYGPDVVAYLKSQGVTGLDYVVGTHPHSDHIGGLDTVIRSFDVGKVLLSEKEHTTKTYERLLAAIEEEEIPVELPSPGDTWQLGSAAVLTVAPYGDDGSTSDNSYLNNWSVGLKITFGDNSFLFCGDAEKSAEEEMEQGGLNLKSEVLKLSHHGSNTSSFPEFLEAVEPRYAVISCGRDNDYGNPHEETLKRVESLGIPIFRTDTQGTVVASSDGRSITWSEDLTGAFAEEESQAVKGEDYIINVNSKKFHKPGCGPVQKMKEYNRKEFRGTKEELVEMGYAACQFCHP